MIVRVDAPLYFLNAGVAQTMIREMAANLPEPSALLIDLSASGDLDIPTMDLIADVDTKLRERGVTLMFAHMRGGVRDRLERANLMDVIGPENAFPTLAAGVEAFLLRSQDHAVRALHDHERKVPDEPTAAKLEEAYP